MKSALVFAFFILFIFFYKNLDNSKDQYEQSLRTNKSSSFISYTTAFDNYYYENKNDNGDVTDKVKIPIWIPKNNTVKMYISGGNGYIYMPLESGVFSEVLKATDYSALVGISDDSVIKTSSGTITKPVFIPSGNIVYVR